MARKSGPDVVLQMLSIVDELRRDSETQGQLLEQLQDANARSTRNLTRMAKVLGELASATTERLSALEARMDALEHHR